MKSRQQLTELIEEYLSGGHLFLVDILVKPGNRITVFIDGDQGVTIEDCRELNHFLNGSLDRDHEDFDLTVSSSGADRPLVLPRQYMKNLGKQLDIILATGQKFRGGVVRADEAGLDLTILREPGNKKTGKNKEITMVSLLYGDIRKATEVVTFKQ